MADTTNEFPTGFAEIARGKMLPMGANYKALSGVPCAIALTGSNKGCVVQASSDPDLLSIGRFGETVDNVGGAARAQEVDVFFSREIGLIHALNDTEGTPVELEDIGSPCYFLDNCHVTANPTGTSIAGIVWGITEEGYVQYEPTARLAPTTDNAAGVGIADADALFVSTTVEGGLAELAKSKAQVNIPITAALVGATGAPLAVFADGAVTTPGVQVTDSKSASVRWNNHATPGKIVINVPYPQDIDETSVVEFHANVSKSGATVGDATRLTVEAFEIVPGALHDADADFGGDTSAIVGNATAKTVTEVSLVLAAANVHAPPAVLCLTIKPKDGTLGTDDLILHGAWLEHTRRNIAG